MARAQPPLVPPAAYRLPLTAYRLPPTAYRLLYLDRAVHELALDSASTHESAGFGRALSYYAASASSNSGIGSAGGAIHGPEVLDGPHRARSSTAMLSKGTAMAVMPARQSMDSGCHRESPRRTVLVVIDAER